MRRKCKSKYEYLVRNGMLFERKYARCMYDYNEDHPKTHHRCVLGNGKFLDWPY